MKKVFLGILAAAILVSAGATASLAASVGGGRRFVDVDDNGVCDYADSGCAYADADGDGVCDYHVSGQSRGRSHGWGHGHGHRQGRGFHSGCSR